LSIDVHQLTNELRFSAVQRLDGSETGARKGESEAESLTWTAHRRPPFLPPTRHEKREASSDLLAPALWLVSGLNNFGELSVQGYVVAIA